MLKKVGLFFSLILILLSFSSCKKEEVIYNDGDLINIDGVIYKYNVPLIDEANNQGDFNLYAYEKPFNSISNFIKYSPEDNPIYHFGYLNDPDTSLLKPYEYEKKLYVRGNDIGLIKEDDGTFSSPVVMNVVPKNDEKNGINFQYAFTYPCFWVVGYDGALNETITIPSTINDVIVAGIAYGAIADYSIDIEILDISEDEQAKVDEKLNGKYGKIPFYILPYGTNNATTISSNRVTYLYPRAINNCNILEFNDDLYLNDSSIYLDKPDNISIDVEKINIPCPNYSGLMNNLPFVNCRFRDFHSESGFMMLSEIYYYELRGNIPPILLNSYNVFTGYLRFPSVLYLSDDLIKSLMIKNNKVKSYITSDEIVNNLDTIIIDKNNSFNVDNNSDFYIENDTLYYNYLNDNELIKIEVLKLNDNIEIKQESFYL